MQYSVLSGTIHRLFSSDHPLSGIDTVELDDIDLYASTFLSIHDYNNIKNKFYQDSIDITGILSNISTHNLKIKLNLCESKDRLNPLHS